MEAIIDEIIANKPHLAGPLRFYVKTVRFMNAVQELRIAVRPGLVSYPPEFTAPILEHLSAAVELPEGSLSPLRQAMELGEIDFTRLPLREVPAFSLPYAEDDLIMLLFLLSRPFFHAQHDARRPDGAFWKDGRCPLCRAQPALASSTRDGGRILVCSFCGTQGHFDRVRCPICQASGHERRQSFAVAGEEGFSAHACGSCRSYVKNVEVAPFSHYGPDLADLVSLPLDIAVQQQGYGRRSPNPVGLLRMSPGG